MKKIKNDIEAIKLIQKLYNNIPQTEEEWDELENLLEEYQPGISNALRELKGVKDPQEILRITRIKNKPIIL